MCVTEAAPGSSIREYSPEAGEPVCRHCLQILTAETIKIRKLSTIHLLILDKTVLRWLALPPPPLLSQLRTALSVSLLPYAGPGDRWGLELPTLIVHALSLTGAN